MERLIAGVSGLPDDGIAGDLCFELSASVAVHSKTIMIGLQSLYI